LVAQRVLMITPLSSFASGAEGGGGIEGGGLKLWSVGNYISLRLVCGTMPELCCHD
jgi:hypothetical protein